MPTIVGTAQTGLSGQVLMIPMPADGVIVFADQGLQDMADADYALIIHNHTNAADEATLARNVRLTTGFTITGPSTSDELDILILGKLKGQVGDGAA